MQLNKVFLTCTAIALLKDKPAGAFIVRDSNTFEGSFGLAVKVSQLPPNVLAKGSKYDSTDTFTVHCLCLCDSVSGQLIGEHVMFCMTGNIVCCMTGDTVSVYNVTGDPQAELVRHFLIEPTAKGVKIKGCSNEPAFSECLLPVSIATLVQIY